MVPIAAILIEEKNAVNGKNYIFNPHLLEANGVSDNLITDNNFHKLKPFLQKKNYPYTNNPKKFEAHYFFQTKNLSTSKYSELISMFDGRWPP